MCSAPSPRTGEGFRAADSRPYGVSRSHSSFIVGAGPRPARQAWGNFRDTAGGTIPYPLCPFGPSPLDKGSLPSPTNRKKTLRVWVGEPLGAPAGGKQRGHPHPPPSGAPSPLEGEGLGPARIRTGSVGLRKPRRMSGTAPATIFANLGPSGPAGIQTSHSDFARRKFCRTHQECVPRNGVRGKATMSTKCSSGAVPGGVLPSFSPWKKKVAARRRRNPLRNFPRKQGGIP